MNPVSRADSYQAVDYTGVLRRRWPIVLVITLICLVGSVGYIAVAPKAYTATASVYVSPTGADNASQSSGSKTGGTVNTSNEAQIVTSGVVATMAGKILHSSLTPSALAKEVVVSIPPNAQTLQIACTTSTSTGAAACANAFATAYLQHRSASSAAAINQQLTLLKSQISGLQKTVAGLNTTISGLPANSPQRAAAQAQLGSDQGQLSALNGKVATLDGQAAQTSGGSIITSASPPSKPVSPKKSLVLPAGVLVGLVLGLIGAFVRDRRDQRIHTARDAERLLGLPVLLSLPVKSPVRQVSLASPRSRTGRVFTELAHDMAASLGEGSHVVLVAGVTPGPAVSVAAASLAAALARTHSEAVLVCAALRDSVAPELFGLADGRGLAEVLAGRATVSEVARGPASVPGLWVIPPGADTVLADCGLQHDTAKALTTELRRGARFVIIEVQSSEDGADTLALAEFADGALLVVEAQRTTRPEGEACLRRLRQLRAQPLGVIVLPPVRPSVTIRPPQQTQPRAGALPDEGRRVGESGRDGGATLQRQMPSLSGTASNARQGGKLVHPGRSAEGYGDQVDRISGS
jgi:capsular polysaccharide biosynthesis protein